MITLITGAPGSGKTLYCVSKLLRQVVGSTVDGVDDDGNKVTYTREVYSNINRLLVEHHKVDEAWLEKWFDNITPGAYIVYDEVQKPWPNRPVGSKVPDYIQRLETHRHQGCDFVLMTQNPQLIDPNVRKLVGRHLHIRRVGNYGGAIVYEWDTCSNSLNFKASFTKSPWRFDKKSQALYKSAEVHTKVPRRVPTAIFIAGLALVGAMFLWPSLISRITKPFQAQAAIVSPGTSSSSSSKSKPTESLFAPGGDLVIQSDQARNGLQAPATASSGLGVGDVLKTAHSSIQSVGDTFAGCVRARDLCVCYSTTGTKVDKPADFCEESTTPGPVQLELKASRVDLELGVDVTARPGTAAGDWDLLRWVYRDRDPYRISVQY